MPTLTTKDGAIKSMRVPEFLTEEKRQVGGFGGASWLYSYQAPGQKYPEITSRYSGFPLRSSDARELRELLAAGPQLIFQHGDAGYSGESSGLLVKKVSPCLGNAGDNQVYNQNTGIEQALFRLERMETCTIAGRAVLKVLGCFHTIENEAKVYLNCIFIDADPAAAECRVEELYLQAFPADLFERHQKDFEDLLASISWVD